MSGAGFRASRPPWLCSAHRPALAVYRWGINGSTSGRDGSNHATRSGILWVRHSERPRGGGGGLLSALGCLIPGPGGERSWGLQVHLHDGVFLMGLGLGLGLGLGEGGPGRAQLGLLTAAPTHGSPRGPAGGIRRKASSRLRAGTPRETAGKPWPGTASAGKARGITVIPFYVPRRLQRSPFSKDGDLPFDGGRWVLRAGSPARLSSARGSPAVPGSRLLPRPAPSSPRVTGVSSSLCFSGKLSLQLGSERDPLLSPHLLVRP